MLSLSCMENAKVKAIPEVYTQHSLPVASMIEVQAMVLLRCVKTVDKHTLRVS